MRKVTYLRAAGQAIAGVLAIVGALVTVLAFAFPDLRDWVNEHGLLVSALWLVVATILVALLLVQPKPAVGVADGLTTTSPLVITPRRATGAAPRGARTDRTTFEDLRRDLTPDMV